MPTPVSPDAIWTGDNGGGRQPDLLGRRQEADRLIAYMHSVLGRKAMREDKRAYTIAVDAPYGEGKSFFLRRLADQLALDHPVAYVDAWTDDLTDEPLTALVATLKAALDPLLAKPEMKERLSDFIDKAGKVAKIVSLGLLRRGAALAVTGASLEAAEGVISGASEAVKDASEAGLKDISEGAVEDASSAIGQLGADGLMAKRIAEFEQAKASVRMLKDSLRRIVQALDDEGLRAPIVIIIDELDRCRPTYSVRVLEEIKHLFDVPGLVFILGMHGEQLAHSVSGAYGSGFDGKGYLRRFIDRQYSLSRPKLTPLLGILLTNAEIDPRLLVRPAMAVSQTQDLNPTIPELIAEYMDSYGLGARDAFELVDVIQTSTALAGGNALHLPYFLPLAIGMMQGLPPGQLPSPTSLSQWVYIPHWSRQSSDVSEYTFAEMATSFETAIQLSLDELEQAAEKDHKDYVIRTVLNHRRMGPQDYPAWTVFGYPRLLRQVAQFKNPQHAEA